MKNTIKMVVAALTLGLMFVGCRNPYKVQCGDIVLENEKARFVIGADGTARSLMIKKTGVEMLDTSENRAVFSVTQDRPFNNEIKLIFPNCQTTYRANRVRREGEYLIVGFELISYSAKLRVKEAGSYFTFELVDFILGPKGTDHLAMTYPPVKTMRMLELPLKERCNFGEWLNVVWDDSAAAAVIAAEPYTWIGNEKRFDNRHLFADAHRDLKLRGAQTALVVDTGKDFLDSVDKLERELGLPLGVESRRSDDINASVYWVGDVTPKNVDEHIALAKQGGFRMMLMYYTACCKGAQKDWGYGGIGHYELRDEYVNGYDSLKEMLDKIKAAGITPGLHVLQTFIGFKTGFVTPVADSRLNLTRHFTLAKPLALEGGDLFVQEDPSNCPTNTKSRILKFGGELISYESFTTERPYKFTGVKRGHLNTKVVPHEQGLIGGILDVCEFGGYSCYIDQNTDLQDEIADKIGRIYNCGFEFMYNDGSEGVNVPQGIHVPNSQYRIWKKMDKKAKFMEGAAKGHFGWHLQSGANAFDIFPPEIFKEMIVRWPQWEAPIMRKDFTRINFGWWGVYLPGQQVSLRHEFPYRSLKTIGTQYDMWEFGTSRAAAWDCPMTIQIGRIKKHPRKDDLLEVIRRWEDVRARKWLTAEQKEALKSQTQEHHLYINEKGEYELLEMELLATPAKAPNTRAFIFERNGKRMIAYWHTNGAAKLAVNLGEAKTVELSGIKYLETSLSLAEAKLAWAAVEEK